MSLLTIPKPYCSIQYNSVEGVPGMRCKTSVLMVDRQAFLVYAVYKSKTSARVGQPLNRSSTGVSYAGEDRGENLFQL